VRSTRSCISITFTPRPSTKRYLDASAIRPAKKPRMNPDNDRKKEELARPEARPSAAPANAQAPRPISNKTPTKYVPTNQPRTQEKRPMRTKFFFFSTIPMIGPIKSAARDSSQGLWIKVRIR
jgi:hypothetical protein